MLVNTNETGLCGATVCGQVLHPCDNDSVYAIYQLKRCVCGVTVETGSRWPYLRLTPGIQVPEGVRDDFERAMFESDEETLGDVDLDRRDGEVTVRVSLDSADLATVENALTAALQWVDDVAYPAALGCVTDCLVRG